MSGKYAPLENFLRDIPEHQIETTLTFKQIEIIINDALPPSAYQYQAWWANEKDGQHTHAHAWMNANWRVDTINLHEKWVRFIRA